MASMETEYLKGLDGTFTLKIGQRDTGEIKK